MAKRVGDCDCCGAPKRVVTQIESGQFLCRECLAELRPP
jgi:hypothetical protein